MRNAREDDDDDDDVEQKKKTNGAMFLSEDEDEDEDETDGDATTTTTTTTTVNAETMTGARRYPHDGATSGAFQAMDVIEALGLSERDESKAWTTRVEGGRGEETPEKIALETNPRLMDVKEEGIVRRDTSLVPMMETPVQEYEGETEAMKRELILAANIGASDASKMFQLSESELNALDCVENDLQQRFDVGQSQSMEEDAGKEAGKLVDYASLTPSTVEPMCIFTPEELLSPLHLLLSMTEKIDERDISSEIFIESEDSRMYLKNLLRPAKLETQQTRRDVSEQVNMNDGGIFPKLMEDVNPETTHASLQKALEPLTARAEEHATMAFPDDLLTKTKENVTQKLLEVPGLDFQLKPMQVPEIDDGEEDFEARTTQIMENIVDSIKDFKQQSKVKPSWNAPFPNFLQALSEVKYDADSDELPSFVPAMDDVVFMNDAEEWSWDGLSPIENSKEAQKKAAEEILQYPALSESKSFSKSEAKNCSIDTVELRLESQHNEMLDIFAQRYAYITQILPLDIQAKVPQFEPSDSQALTDMLKHFKHESSTILGHLSSLLCCQIAAHLMQTYGIHDTYSYMNNRAKNEPDLQDITRLLGRHDATVQKGALINHPKLRELKSLLARLVVTGGKMLLIFPSVMGILSIKRFVAKCGMRISQFDAKQEFKHMTKADHEDFARAVSIAAEGSDVLIVLEEHLAQECFPLKLFSTCVYYAPSLDTISSVTALRHSMNEFVYVFKVKDERRWLQELEPASSAFNHAPAEKSNQQVVDKKVFDEPLREASPAMDLSGVPRHVVVMNTSRQIFKARELLFLETEALLSKEGYEVVFRESSIDVDACVTRGDHVHAVIMIVPEYFAEDYPSQLEILSLSEDLTAAMANSFHSGTIVFEGNLDFLRLAQSIERRLCLDSKQLGVELDVKYFVDIDIIEGLFSVLSCGSESSNFSGSIPNKPSVAESELCSAFPMLNPISACMMLADDEIKNVLDITGRVDREVIEYVRAHPVLGCPLSVLGDASPSSQANAFESGILSPRDSELRVSHRGLEHVTDETFRNLRSFSLDESPIGPSIQQRKVDIPSPALDLSTSPPGTPRSLFSPVSQRHFTEQNPPPAAAGGRLWQTKPRQEPPKAPSRTMGSPSTFPNIIESYRMPRTTEDTKRPHSTDMNRDLTQHRFSRIQSSNKKRLPDDWK